jgi:hypothetical protein
MRLTVNVAWTGETKMHTRRAHGTDRRTWEDKQHLNRSGASQGATNVN